MDGSLQLTNDYVGPERVQRPHPISDFPELLDKANTFGKLSRYFHAMSTVFQDTKKKCDSLKVIREGQTATLFLEHCNQKSPVRLYFGTDLIVASKTSRIANGILCFAAGLVLPVLGWWLAYRYIQFLWHREQRAANLRLKPIQVRKTIDKYIEKADSAFKKCRELQIAFKERLQNKSISYTKADFTGDALPTPTPRKIISDYATQI